MGKFSLACLLFLASTFTSKAQVVSDLFTKSETEIYWLGIDFSQVKLIGDFSQFGEAGSIGVIGIRDKYFSAWNQLILSEPTKYDVAGMFRKPEMKFNTDAITVINSKASVEEMEAPVEPHYTKEDIQGFIKNYKFGVTSGIGLLMVAESLNKTTESGKYHFVAVNLATNEILLYEAIVGKAGGFGLRNYWARSFYEVIIAVRDNKYKNWKKQYAPK